MLNMSNKQIFILGAARSGTSVIRNMLADNFAIPSHGEGHILQLASRHLALSHSYLSSMRSMSEELSVKLISDEDILILEAEFVHRLYGLVFPSLNFLDKTPSSEAAHTWRLIKYAFPESKLIFCVRNPVDVINSALLKFKDRNIDFEESCVDYDGCLKGLVDLMGSRFQGDCYVLDHRRTYLDRHALASELLDFLGYEREHVAKLMQYLEVNWSDNLTMNPDAPGPKSIDDMRWSEDMKLMFSQHCGKWVSLFSDRFVTNSTVQTFAL